LELFAVLAGVPVLWGGEVFGVCGVVLFFFCHDVVEFFCSVELEVE
jgi:hypothetical protein